MTGLQDYILSRSIPVPWSGCWLWTSTLSTDGYARGSYGHKYLQQAHRLSYEAFREEIPPLLTIDHLCRVRCCVNPDHMEVVPTRINTLRGFGPSALNARRTHCISGHPLSGDNLKVGSTTGKRFCRACWRRRSAEYQIRKKASVP